MNENGYPIEVAAVGGTRAGIAFEFSTIIKPRKVWRTVEGWSEQPQRIHGLTLLELSRGLEADVVCDILERLLGASAVVVDGGTYDAFWLERLYEGRKRALELDHLTLVDGKAFLAKKRAAEPRHRALPDARWLWWTVADLLEWDAPARPLDC